jgi:hypothetical protein
VGTSNVRDARNEQIAANGGTEGINTKKSDR